ncbi:MAG: efflux RND transporter periplasmic adaptor subunit [Mariprofundaceae bacterium]|nr:efflux RND transporter periplasmic adaptor subunit [Mariprofundaceae bacterium]
MNNLKLTIGAISMLIGGLVIGYFASQWLSPSSSSTEKTAKADGPCPDGSQALSWRNPMNPAITSPVFSKDEMGMNYLPICAEAKVEKKVLFYRNPMNPAVTSPIPAKDNMGMDYIPVYAEGSDNSNSPTGTVRINATVIQNIGVRTTKAVTKNISRDVHTIGRVTYDEQRVTRLHPKIDGWIEELFVQKTGDKVSKGDMLLAIYSPQLVASGEEYLLALNNWKIFKDSPFPDIRDGAKRLLQTSLQRLKLLDVPAHQLRDIRQRGRVPKAIHIHSPFDGIVINIGARDGQRITPDTELYMIADLSHVWVIVDLYEDDLPWVKEGDTAVMTVSGILGKKFTGIVSYIYPYLEAKTRTVKMRLEFDNSDLQLKPEMFAKVTVQAGRQLHAIVVPSEAIVRTGEQEQVFVQREKGKYEPRKVVVGVDSEGEAQIIEGLKAGEIVVTSSQFLIDSESKLKEATAKMLEAQQIKSKPSMQMDDMKMDDMKMDDMQMDGMKMDGMQMDGMKMDDMQMDDMQMDDIKMDDMKMEGSK